MDSTNDQRPDESSIDPELPWRDESLLAYLYHERELTMYETATVLDCAYTTIQKWMNRHGIERRPSGKPTHVIPRDVLVSLHTERGYSVSQIADELGRSTDTVRRYLRRHDVPPPRSNA